MKVEAISCFFTITREVEIGVVVVKQVGTVLIYSSERFLGSSNMFYCRQVTRITYIIVRVVSLKSFP